MDLFFVLSGFLVGGLLFNELRGRGKLDVPRFLIRRGFKIWPSYYVYLAAVAVLMARRSVPGLAASLLPNLLNVQNYFGTPLQHTWSLAVEEHFYLALPLLLLWAPRRRNSTAGMVVSIPAIPVIAIALIIGHGMAISGQRPMQLLGVDAHNSNRFTYRWNVLWCSSVLHELFPSGRVRSPDSPSCAVIMPRPSAHLPDVRVRA